MRLREGATDLVSELRSLLIFGSAILSRTQSISPPDREICILLRDSVYRMPV